MAVSSDAGELVAGGKTSDSFGVAEGLAMGTG